ncbi:MAG: lytic murein transglycosylase [Caulobacteraceae bacterium]|nr:lytic murein transglycosylase [Caulobacteraceae bacterium]
MDRRAFLIMALAGAADSGSGPSAPSAPQGMAAAPEPAALSADPAFEAWSREFVGRAILSGLPAEVVTREMTGLAPDSRVVALDSRQPEFAKPISDYIKGVVTDERIALGRRKADAIAALPRIEADYGVPREVLVSIWAVETAFGSLQGDFDVIRSLATLAASGRRRDWAEEQLIAAIRIVADGEATRGQLRGSWAGAMGQTQFEPYTYLTMAVDGDGDGRRDVWGSSADALASAGNLLTRAGWLRGQRWDREVVLPPGFDYSLTEGPRQDAAAWAALGVMPAAGGGWATADAASQAQLLLPTGAAGPAFLAFDNHFVIRKYNNSTAYALAVGLLADRIGGAPPLATPWPHEDPLSLADRTAAQSALARLGYPPGALDGVIGANTRAALRQWQKAKGLPADGYLSLDVVRRLQAEVPTAADAPPPQGAS